MLFSEVGFFAELALIGRTEDNTGDGALSIVHNDDPVQFSWHVTSKPSDRP